MSYTLDNRLLPKRDPDQATDCRPLVEDFATWQGVALAKDTVHRSAEHENSFFSDCAAQVCARSRTT